MKKIELIEFNWIIVVAYGVYFLSLPVLTSLDTETMGQMGDYIGGHLGAVFGFLSFLILLSSYNLQSEAMKITKEEAKSAEELNKKQIELMAVQAKSSRSEAEFKTFSLYSDLLNTKLDDIKFYVMVKQSQDSIFHARVPELRCVGFEAIKELVQANINNRPVNSYKISSDQIINFLVVYANASDWINNLESSENKKIFCRILTDFFGDVLNVILSNRDTYSFVTEDIFSRVEKSCESLSGQK